MITDLVPMDLPNAFLNLLIPKDSTAPASSRRGLLTSLRQRKTPCSGLKIRTKVILREEA